jgi:class 3 adenylate cyclase
MRAESCRRDSGGGRRDRRRLPSRHNDLDFGAGIALGYATCGEIGFEDRSDYAAIGVVTNLASRVADEATASQILITQRLYAEVEDDIEAESVGEFRLKGFQRPVAAFNVVAVRAKAAAGHSQIPGS